MTSNLVSRDYSNRSKIVWPPPSTQVAHKIRHICQVRIVYEITCNNEELFVFMKYAMMRNQTRSLNE